MDFHVPPSAELGPKTGGLSSDQAHADLVVPVSQVANALGHTDPSSDQLVMETLRSVRSLLGMEVAFVSEFKGGRRIFRYVDSDWADVPVHVGNSDPLEESYCQRVVDGRLPQVIQDATQVPEALTLPVTCALPVGAHLSVPLRFSDGRIYGTYCCFSTYPDYTLGERDARIMRLFADMVARVIERQALDEREREELIKRLRTAMDDDDFVSVYQPIFNVASNKVVGYEALTRFVVEPILPPDHWFNEAAKVDLQEELELAAIRKALKGLDRLPPNTYLSLNAAPATIIKGSLESTLKGYPTERLIVEITEHVSIGDYAPVAAALDRLRRQGVRLAVDDAGSGFASFRHILKLKPDLIKLDISLIQKIDSDPGSRALAAALIRFAEETGSTIVAEGVETEAELAVLRELHVDKVQGFLLGCPAPLESVCR